jgi:isocitrate dehydrogenase kinase/phosphatase
MRSIIRAPDLASLILDHFLAYREEFAVISRRASRRFAVRDWIGGQLDAAERLGLYDRVLGGAVAQVEGLAKAGGWDHERWPEVKVSYAELVAGADDDELAETFYNSVARRVLRFVGVDRGVEFVHLGEHSVPPGVGRPIHRTYTDARSTETAVRELLSDIDLGAPFEALDRDARLAAETIETRLAPAPDRFRFDAIEVLPDVFYRNKGAYVVGRLRKDAQVTPLVFALLNGARGVVVDAVLTSSDDVSIVFGFTRSYFHVETDRPLDIVAFLATIMPSKRLDELYTSIGFNRHGKTAFYRALYEHLHGHPAARFEIAEGKRGMVMAVFTLPSWNVVFKVIKDRFDFPKTTTRRAVMRKYRLVFAHDRVGRLADAQEFEALEFSLERFSPDLLAELRREAGSMVKVSGDRVLLRHLYTERRVTPLDIFLARNGDTARAREAVIDYGNAVKDLAAANIFPGDMLLKNFGVTRHGRVIFYDYDELCLLTDCNFRTIPPPRHPEDELAAEPWFYVGEFDIFPQEFTSFLEFPPELTDVFMVNHADLLDVEFWRDMQARHEAGEVLDVFPYHESRRLIRR